MKNKAYIYGLVDPRDQQIHYIGSARDVVGRYASHLHRNGKTDKDKWLADLKSAGMVPQMLVLSVTDNRQRWRREREWIKIGLNAGWPLVNMAGTQWYTKPEPEPTKAPGARLEWRSGLSLLGIVAFVAGCLLSLWADYSGDLAYLNWAALMLGIWFLTLIVPSTISRWVAAVDAAA